MQLPYRINLLGAYEQETGDVVTQDGEFIGVWSLVDDVFYDFTPLNSEKPIFSHPFIKVLCDQIDEWLERQIECSQ